MNLQVILVRIPVITTFSLFVPTKPQPASRPRISRYGNYYPKAYTDFRKEIYQFFKTIQKDHEAIDKVSFKIELEIICKKPRIPTNKYPRGDVDNYVKAYLDSITYAQLFWVDDIQVTELVASKRYQKKGEEYGAFITVQQLGG